VLASGTTETTGVSLLLSRRTDRPETWVALPREQRESNEINDIAKGLGESGAIVIQEVSESPPKPSSSATNPARMRARDPATTGPESSLGATEQLEPEATEDEPVEVAPRGSNPLLTPLTSEEEQHLTLAAEALGRHRLGFEDRHLYIVQGLRAARRAAWKAAWDAGDTQQRVSLKLPSGLPNYHAHSYKQRFREVLLRFFGEYWYAPGEEQPVRNNRSGQLSACLSIGENLEKPADPKLHHKPGFLYWYRGLREGERYESPKRLWAAYRSDVLGVRERKLDNRSERDRERNDLEKRIIGLENKNTALQAEVWKRDEQIEELMAATTTEEGLAQKAIALGPNRARTVMERIAALLEAKVTA